jgi:hypothetical protein
VNDRRNPADIETFRTRARRLLDRFRSDDPDASLAAARRLQRLPAFADLRATDLLARPGLVRCKHALAAIAEEEGCSSWSELERTCECGAGPPRTCRDAAGGRAGSGFRAPRAQGALHHWFSSHAAARRHLDAAGGFLFPYLDQCFVCDAETVRALGLDPEDPDWERMGRDWIDPADREARMRLETKLRRARRRI